MMNSQISDIGKNKLRRDGKRMKIDKIIKPN